MRYDLPPGGGHLRVDAHAPLHDFHVQGPALTGWLDLDPASGRVLAGEITVDLAQLHAGDALRDRQLREFLALDRHPLARCRLEAAELTPNGGGWQGRVAATLDFQGRAVPVQVPVQGHADTAGLRGEAHLRLRLTSLGLQPPKLLFLQVADEIAVTAQVAARAAPPDPASPRA